MKDAFYYGPGQKKIGVIAGQPGMPSYTTFYCKECGERAIYRPGAERTPHFAHFRANENCDLSSRPSDYYAGTGKHFAKIGPIEEQFNTPVSETGENSSRAVQLNLWLTLFSNQGQDPKFGFYLELPWLPVDAPDLDRLHMLDLRVPGAFLRTETESWRLWPGQVDNRVPVHLKQEYNLDLDRNWPPEKGWRREGLQAAKLRLNEDENTFLVSESSVVSGQLLTLPIELEPGSQLLLLARAKEPPPEVFQPRWEGLIQEEGEWNLWRMSIPDEPNLTDEDQYWLTQRGWVIHSPRVVRIVSPPPVGFEFNVPIYPASKGGWVLMRGPQQDDASVNGELWLMEDPLPGRCYSLDEGHAPQAAKCKPLPSAWSDIPSPFMMLRTPEGGEQVLNLWGGRSSFPRETHITEGLQVFIQSLFPVEVMAGPPGQTVKVCWRPDRPLDRVGSDLVKALRSKKAYEIIILGPGLAKQVVRLEAVAEVSGTQRGFGYHHRLRQMVGWPAYLLPSRMTGA